MAAIGDTQRVYVRISSVILLCTLILTFSFLGILAIISGDFDTSLVRLPWYLLAGAAGFVASVVLLEQVGSQGVDVIATAAVNGLFVMIVAALTVEGIIFTLQNPSDVFVSQLVLYFVAAGLVGTGIAYWALRHWREFTHSDSQL